jgi:hypothetical protein
VIPVWLRKIATGRAVAVALLLWLGYSALILKWGPYPLLKASILELPEEDLTPTAEESHKKLGQLGERGRKRYLDYQMLEIVNALLATIAATLLLTHSIPRLFGPRTRWAFLIYLPAAGGISQLIENSILASAVARHPQWSPSALGIASAATAFKLISGTIVLPVTLFLFAKLGLRALRTRKKRTRTSSS